VAFFALSSALLSPVTSAHAGSWQLSVTGDSSGTATASADGTAKPTHTWVAPATVAAPSSTPGQPVPGSSITLPSVSNGASWVTVVTPESVSASASLSATVTGTWVPNSLGATKDPPPSTVVLTETSTATGVQMHTDSNDNTVTTAGSANDWLGDPVGTTSPHIGVASGTHYVSQSVSGGTFSVNVVMSASSGDTSGPDGTNGEGDPFNGSAGCSASVGATTITVDTPAINISGTYDPLHGDYDLLTGLPCTAHLSGAIGAVTSNTWSASPTGSSSPSGYVFKDYDIDAPDSTNSTQLVQLLVTDLLGPTAPSTTVADLTFYDRKQENLIVTCNVTMTAPDGTSLSLFEESPQVSVLKPTASITINSLPGTPTGFIDDTVDYQFGANELWIPVTISVPAPYSGGRGCFAQLILSNDRENFRTLPDGYSQTWTNKVSDGNGGWVSPTGLDTDFPYRNGYNYNPDGTLNTAQPVTTGYTWDVSNKGASGDLPWQPCVGHNVPDDGGGNLWYKSTASDSFKTYVMYQPEGGVWVPLQMLSWQWSGTAEIGNNGIWQITSQAFISDNSATNTDDPPQWQAKVTSAYTHP
jgi:hypothetical protein